MVWIHFGGYGANSLGFKGQKQAFFYFPDNKLCVIV